MKGIQIPDEPQRGEKVKKMWNQQSSLVPLQICNRTCNYKCSIYTTSFRRATKDQAVSTTSTLPIVTPATKETLKQWLEIR